MPLFGPSLPCPPVFANDDEFREFLLVKSKSRCPSRCSVRRASRRPYRNGVSEITCTRTPSRGRPVRPGPIAFWHASPRSSSSSFGGLRFWSARKWCSRGHARPCQVWPGHACTAGPRPGHMLQRCACAIAGRLNTWPLLRGLIKSASLSSGLLRHQVFFLHSTLFFFLDRDPFLRCFDGVELTFPSSAAVINGEKAAFNTPTFAQKRERTLDMLIKDLHSEHMPDGRTVRTLTD